MDNSLVNLSNITYDAEEERAVTEVIRSGWISMGDVTRDFEKEFGEYIGSSHVLAVSNGTAALHLALVSLGIGSGDEVIVPSMTFVATVNAVRYTGAKPVFADIKSLDDWTICPDSIRERITPRTRAIMVMHYGGFPCDMQAITDIAEQNNLFLIEDAAHGPGSWAGSRHIGTIGDAGCFSFFANKNMTSGEGGAVVTNNGELSEKIGYLRSHGMTTLTWDRHRGHAYQYEVVSLGYNYRFDDIRAALARVQLKKLPENNRKRREAYGYYRELLEDVAEMKIPFKDRKEKVSCHLFPVLFHEKIDRLEFMKKLRAAGIQTSIHYRPVHLFPIYCHLNPGPLPYTETVGKHALSLPLHPLLGPEDIQHIAEKVKGCL